MTMDAFLFIAFPYVALVLAVGVGIYRKLRRPYTYSSLSSQILENRKLFWGSAPWHYGITLILLAHLLAALFPQVAGWILGGRIRLLVLELTGMALAFFALFGLIVLIIRRLPSNSLARHVPESTRWGRRFRGRGPLGTECPQRAHASYHRPGEAVRSSGGRGSCRAAS